MWAVIPETKQNISVTTHGTYKKHFDSIISNTTTNKVVSKVNAILLRYL